MTNGDVIKKMFPNLECTWNFKDTSTYLLEPNNVISPKITVFDSWWNAPYEQEGSDDIND